MIISDLAKKSHLPQDEKARHFVQFYREDKGLVDSVAGFFRSGFELGEGGILIATPPHREAVEKALARSGYDLAALKADGRWESLDARETLARLLSRGVPDEKLFKESIGRMVARMTSGGRGLRAFGEMVALLWSEGDSKGAIGLERHWNALSDIHRFSLMCAYPWQGFRGSSEAEGFDHVCKEHSWVIPAEPLPEEASLGEYGLRALANLQYKALSLEAEISKREGIEAELRLSQRRLTHYLESASIGLHWVRQDGTILWANAADHEMLGYTREEYIGRNIADFHADPEHIADILARLLRDEKLKDREARLKCKDGSIKTVLIDSSALWEQGRFIHTQCFTRDVTASKRFEGALKESENRFRLMADSAPVLILMLGREGNCEYANRPWLEFTGRPLERESGTGWTENIHPEDLGNSMDALASAMNQGSKYRMEFRMRRFDGAYRWVLATGVPRYSQDRALQGFMGTCIDITDFKESEERLRHSHKMEAVGRLAGGIAHDFNNLLTAIIGYTDLAAPLAKKEDVLPEYLTEIKKSGERAASLTRQLLAYSRKQAVTERVFNLNTVAVGMEKMLQRTIGADIEFRTILEPGLPPIKADQGQIENVIMNLALNARDAMLGGGRLILETSTVAPSEAKGHLLTEFPAGRLVLLSVRDTGTGMSKEVKERIFEPFFTTKEVGKGTGLGLASAYGIIKQSGGDISVETEPGRGSVFRIYFPIAAEPKAVSPDLPKSAFPSAGKGAAILVAEDEETVRRLIGLTLASKGHSVLEAKDGKEALDAAGTQGPVDLLITDILMPKLNGGELAERLRRRQPGLKVLFISGYTKNIVESEKFCDPVSDFLQKPFSPADLVQRVEALLGNRVRTSNPA